jgi:pimeloyl-ACP methyl ester carboxylesterase
LKIVVWITVGLFAGCAAENRSHAAAGLTEAPVTFKAQSGETVSAFEGSFVVPENRANPDSRILTLHYVRFPATGENPGAPIVYLAGGPGGSGIWFASRWRFPLFMAMREFGDVIAFDQRGTGASDDTPSCTSSQVLDDTTVISDATYIEMHQAALQECLGFWKDRGIDVQGYNTLESVADLDALRAHLGAEKLSLWGISYGTHLALAAIKEIEDRIERVVMASAEGLDQTIKQPARTDAYFDRLQDAIDTQPAA